jgi:hypothetical protein
MDFYWSAQEIRAYKSLAAGFAARSKFQVVTTLQGHTMRRIMERLARERRRYAAKGNDLCGKSRNAPQREDQP